MDTFLHNWWLPPPRRDRIETFASELSLSRPIASVLSNRRFEDSREAAEFLYPKLEHLHDPFLLIDMELAVKRILRAIDSGEEIVIYGHDDVDGMTSALVLFQGIKTLQGQVRIYIPDRISEGIGLNMNNLHRFAREGVKLVITVDCSIGDRHVLENVDKLPVDIIITDHHEVRDATPDTVPFVNPKRSDSLNTFRDLAGVGVSFKVAQTLLSQRDYALDQFFNSVGDMIALGTLADRVPLVDENRVFTKLGFHLIQNQPRPSLAAIADLCSEVGSIQTGFVMRSAIHILSSAVSVQGRNAGVELLLTVDQKRAAQVAEGLFKASHEWQQTLHNSYERITKKLRRERTGNERTVFIIDDVTPPKILGACAAKLMREYYRPAVVLGFYKDRYLGESRAPKGFDWIELFEQCRDLLITFGGHKQAAGFSVFPEHVEDFRDRIHELVKNMFVPAPSSGRLDAVVDISSLDQHFFQGLELFAPFGRENPNPFFLSRGVSIVSDEPQRVDERRVRIGTILSFPLIVTQQLAEVFKKKGGDSAQCDIIFQLSTSDRGTPYIILRDLRKTVLSSGKEGGIFSKTSEEL